MQHIGFCDMFEVNMVGHWLHPANPRAHPSAPMHYLPPAITELLFTNERSLFVHGGQEVVDSQANKYVVATTAVAAALEGKYPLLLCRFLFPFPSW